MTENHISGVFRHPQACVEAPEIRKPLRNNGSLVQRIGAHVTPSRDELQGGHSKLRLFIGHGAPLGGEVHWFASNGPIFDRSDLMDSECWDPRAYSGALPLKICPRREKLRRREMK